MKYYKNNEIIEYSTYSNLIHCVDWCLHCKSFLLQRTVQYDRSQCWYTYNIHIRLLHGFVQILESRAHSVAHYNLNALLKMCSKPRSKAQVFVRVVSIWSRSTSHQFTIAITSIVHEFRCPRVGCISIHVVILLVLSHNCVCIKYFRSKLFYLLERACSGLFNC